MTKEKVTFIGVQRDLEGYIAFSLVNVLSTMSTVKYDRRKHVIMNREEYENRPKF